ncbi:MAG: hypothetical protein KAQ98_03605 [Bacteriovoracaceae bacterium]|nr:hypothetical protein [Bacteriovoracaceae bacterium]
MKNILLGLMILASIASFAGNAQSIEIEIPENYGVNSDLDKLCVINAGSDYKFQEGTIVPAQGEVITLDSGGSESIASGAKYMVTKSISCKKVSDLSNVCQNSARDAEGYVWVCPRFKNQAISACHHARSSAERSGRSRLANYICQAFGYEEYRHYHASVNQMVEARAMIINSADRGIYAYEISGREDGSFSSVLRKNKFYTFNKFKCK